MGLEMVHHVVFTSRAHGDFSRDAPAEELQLRRRAVVDLQWSWLRQVHGSEVLVVDEPGDGAGAAADAMVTAAPDAVLSIQTADCAGVVLAGYGNSGSVVAVGAAHAGWRGLSAGVLQKSVRALESLGAQRVAWRMGPCISPEVYEFGESDLDALDSRYGGTVRAVTTTGRPSLDLRAAVRAAMAEVDADETSSGSDTCTAGNPDYFSWRGNRDTGRQVSVTWMSRVRN